MENGRVKRRLGCRGRCYSTVRVQEASEVQLIFVGLIYFFGVVHSSSGSNLLKTRCLDGLFYGGHTEFVFYKKNTSLKVIRRSSSPPYCKVRLHSFPQDILFVILIFPKRFWAGRPPIRTLQWNGQRADVLIQVGAPRLDVLGGHCSCGVAYWLRLTDVPGGADLSCLRT